MRKRLTVGRAGRAALAILVFGLSLSEYHVGNVAAARELKRSLGTIDDRVLRQALRRLEKSGLVTPDGETWRLTPRGGLAAAARTLGVERVPIDAPRENGDWCVACFDVPGRKSREREALRLALRAIGFEKAQKSVYVHPNALPAAKAVARAASILGAERRLLVTVGPIDGR